jgi:hypothetical protein
LGGGLAPQAFSLACLDSDLSPKKTKKLLFRLHNNPVIACDAPGVAEHDTAGHYAFGR